MRIRKIFIMLTNIAIENTCLSGKEYNLVLDYTAVDRKSWEEFVNNHPEGNIFQRPEMYEVFARTTGFEPILIVVEKNQQIVGLMLAAIQKEVGGIIGLFAKRSIIRGGPLVVNNDEEILTLILETYNEISRNRALYSQIRNWAEAFGSKSVFQKQGFQFIDHLNILIDLTQTEEYLWQNIQKRKKNRIRKAYRENFQFQMEKHQNDLGEAYEIIKEVYQRVKLPVPDKEFFEELQERLVGETELLIFSAKFETRIIAVRFVLSYKKCLYVFYSGANQQFQGKGVNDLINWELMLWGKRNSFTIFDFAGAGNPNIPYGVRDYKMKFGGQVINPGRYEKIHQPLLFVVAKQVFYVWRKLKS